MSDEKHPSTEESPETHPEVTGEVVTGEEPEAPAADSGVDAGERPEAAGAVTVGAEPEDEGAGAETDSESAAAAAEEPDGEDPGEVSETTEGPEELVVETAAEGEAVDAEEPGVVRSEAEPAQEAAQVASEGDVEASAPQPKKKRKRKRKRKKPQAEVGDAEDSPAADDPPELVALRAAKEQATPVDGRVFGWNNGGFHVVVGEVPAFCPRSEMEADGRLAEPESYLDQTLEFLVIRIQGKARRVVLSRSALERRQQHRQREETLKEIATGSVATGTVTSVVEFGAFVDLGGVEGLVHRTELTRRRYDRIEDVVAVGDQVEVKVLKIEKGGRRISLSMKALEVDPWKDVAERFAEGSVVVGKVEHTAPPGAFVELEPGLTGLLPTSEMNIPREAIPARIFPPGKEVKVVVMSLDSRRRRISLALEGSKPGASHRDLAEFQKSQKQDESGFGALAAAFAKLGGGED